MTPEQHKAFSEACSRFGDALAKIFGTEAPTMERQEGYDQVTPEVIHARNWEILEFGGLEGEHFKLNSFNRLFQVDGCSDEWTTTEALEAGFTIHSVRRLSDNTVWTVGDKVANDTGRHGNITAFHISANNRIRVDADCFLLSRDLDQLRIPEKKPLFATADGVPLYDREQLVYDLSISGSNYTGRIFEGYAWQIFDWNYAYSTREAAEKAYNIWMESQPVLSFKDVSEWDNSPNGWDRLREIVKQKIANR